MEMRPSASFTRFYLAVTTLFVRKRRKQLKPLKTAFMCVLATRGALPFAIKVPHPYLSAKKLMNNL